MCTDWYHRQDTNPDITVPANAGDAEGTALDWSYVTVPQLNLSGSSISWPRGKVSSVCGTPTL